jgi:hypothetical protein
MYDAFGEGLVRQAFFGANEGGSLLTLAAHGGAGIARVAARAGCRPMCPTVLRSAPSASCGDSHAVICEWGSPLLQAV